ncbi:MAG: 5-formyltetrahydrofolate cyclo-ligase [Spirochaetaceae bacterium]|nr:5-formyltetrahydrofolate cyclo-ligase [Spirochaetaceae bacterium]
MSEDSKKTARKAAQSIISTLGKQHRESAAAAACKNLKAEVYWKEAGTLLAYLAFGAELDADPVIQAALDEGKSVYVPRVRRKMMSFHQVESLDERFEKGVFGIREPMKGSREWNALTSSRPILILVPGLAFDKKGVRLGRGGGYYDRFLSAFRKEKQAAGLGASLCIGYAYSEQINGNVPAEEYDALVDGLVTDGFSGLF